MGVLRDCVGLASGCCCKVVLFTVRRWIPINGGSCMMLCLKDFITIMLKLEIPFGISQKVVILYHYPNCRCVCACVRAYMHIYLFMYVCVCVCMCVSALMCACMCVCYCINDYEIETLMLSLFCS